MQEEITVIFSDYCRPMLVKALQYKLFLISRHDLILISKKTMHEESVNFSILQVNMGQSITVHTIFSKRDAFFHQLGKTMTEV